MVSARVYLQRYCFAYAIYHATFLDIPPASVGTQIVVAVIVGLLTAFAVQFLLTNLGLALGISLLKYRPQASSKQAAASSQSESGGISVDISFFAGLGILFTLNTVLFIACFLAVRFSTASDPISGSTLGIVIWSTYFLILIWASYSAVGSFTGWVFGSVATSLRQLIKAIALLIPGTEESASELLTEEAAENLIQEEIEIALGKFDLQQRIDDYLNTVPSPQLNLTAITQDFANLLAKLDLKSFAETNLLQKIDRQTFIALIDEHTNLSTSEVEQIADRLESVWQQAVDRYEEKDLNGELLQFLQSANPEELQFEQLVKRMEQTVGKESDRNSVDLDRQSSQVNDIETDDEIDDDHDSAIQSWSTIDWRAIKNALLTRVDLSEIDLEDVWHNLQSLYQQTNSSEEEFKLPFNTISNDIEDYLWHVPPWYLNCERGWQEFKEVIYDPQADPARVRSQLELVQPENFVELLQQRDDIDAAKIDEIVEHLKIVRQEVFDLIEQAELSAQKQELSDRLQDYLQQAELSELQADNLPSRLEQLLIESNVNLEILTQFLSDWQQLDWHTWLQQRQDLEPTKLEQTAAQLAEIGDRLLEKVANWQVQIASTAKELQHKLESYLRYTNLDHLTPAKIDDKLEQLWQASVDRLPKIQQQLPDIDGSILLEILERRKGTDIEQVEVITTQIETKWQKLNDSITPEISQLQAKTRSLSKNLVDDLYQAIAQNLNEAEIEVDLSPLLNLAQGKTKTLVDRQLARVNWNEIEAKLTQAQKGSERQIKQAIKQARSAARQLVKLPQRWATRASEQTQDLVNELEDFFSHANKIEFTSEHLERNLKSIIHRSKAQSHSNSNSIDRNLDRLATKILQSLSERKDLTPVQVEQISDRFVAISDRLSQEIKTQQGQTNELIQTLHNRFDEYLSTLNLSHLDYDRLQESLANFNFQSLTDSWQETIAATPLEELGDRLGQLSHETLATIIETNELFYDSTSTQIQGIQDYIAQQIETIKLTAYQRTENLKQKTLQQVETTRKAIATAVYWMFAITFTSAIASALAGFLATRN